MIGGGDTGADCVGKAVREGARSIVQLELVPEPPARRPDDRTPWPRWPQQDRLSYAMKEAQSAGVGELDFSIVTTRFTGDGDGGVDALHVARGRAGAAVRSGRRHRARAAGRARAARDGLPAPRARRLLERARRRARRARQRRGVEPYATSVEGVFAAGDARRGQSLIVWAINEGRQCARIVNRYLGERVAASESLAGSGGGDAPSLAPHEDEGLNGHADADEGPEGPPQHVSPGIAAD